MSLVHETNNRRAYLEGLAEDAADRLRGTCSDVPHLGEEFEDALEELDFCQALDEKVFCCIQCGWWDDQPAEENAGGEWICHDCWQENQDDQ